MRLLNDFELLLVVGGRGTTTDILPGDDGPPIVVTGRPDGGGGDFGGGGFDGGYGDDGGGYGGGGGQAMEQPQPEPEIVVNGIRQDPADRDEVLLERQWTANGGFPAGQWANAEYTDRGWVITAASAPTQDQKDFKSNFDKVNAALWGHLSNSQQIALASAFTDLKVDLAGSNINVGAAYGHYKSLLESGEVQGNTSLDFATWVANGGR